MINLEVPGPKDALDFSISYLVTVKRGLLEHNIFPNTKFPVNIVQLIMECPTVVSHQ